MSNCFTSASLVSLFCQLLFVWAKLISNLFTFFLFIRKYCCIIVEPKETKTTIMEFTPMSQLEIEIISAQVAIRKSSISRHSESKAVIKAFDNILTEIRGKYLAKEKEALKEAFNAGSSNAINPKHKGFVNHSELFLKEKYN